MLSDRCRYLIIVWHRARELHVIVCLRMMGNELAPYFDERFGSYNVLVWFSFNMRSRESSLNIGHIGETWVVHTCVFTFEWSDHRTEDEKKCLYRKRFRCRLKDEPNRKITFLILEIMPWAGNQLFREERNKPNCSFWVRIVWFLFCAKNLLMVWLYWPFFCWWQKLSQILKVY